ncbi:hypothetical protein [Parasitella parasitica]|uniref:Amidohydrolase-related domain-containing protein n=1 Tax=Parasitella parasitica TaxID=35722 RepID=A0A0B7N9C3_9FUNG|nr:hypothetical protein [Parasitella parasitica]
MSTPPIGYNSISSTTNNEEGDAQERRFTSVQHLKDFNYRMCAKKYHLPVVVSSAIILFILLLVGLATWLPDIKHKNETHLIDTPITPGISYTAFHEGLAKCREIHRSKPSSNVTTTRGRTFNPRAPNDIQPVVLRNAVVWDGQGEILNHVDILMDNGIISQVTPNIQAPASAKIIDVGGHIVTPGIIDMHTHLGVASWPLLSGTSDTNEKTNPITPFVRTLDAFNPSDKAIRIVSSGGITTTLVLPGSGNLIGGEAFAFKLRPVHTMSNQDMLVQNGIDEKAEQKWRYMKMACGENPKSYGRMGRMPSTRLGESYQLRQAFSDAQKLVEAQEDWCSAAENLPSNHDVHFDRHFPQDIRLELLTALLRGQVKLNIHCYETHDIEAMMRHANEFNFEISAFHHALEAYKIPNILKRASNNITIATFADHWGYKKEAFGASPRAPKYLYEAGIPVALKSDHPVLNSQHMAFEAAKATHYGLPPQEAFKAITSVPANALGLGHRVGSLKVGYDADVVIWDRSPLTLGAAPLQVFIDGVPQFDEKSIAPIKRDLIKNNTFQPKGAFDLPKEGTKNYILINIGSNHISKSNTIVVQNGQIVCTTPGEDCESMLIQTDFETIDVQGGYVLPGLIAVGPKLGLVEMPSESATGDGIVPSTFSQNPKSVIEAVDGLKLGTKKLEEAYKGGVLTTISSPISKNIVIGISTAFKTKADSILSDGALLSSAAALHLQIGNAVKSDSIPTVSSQIGFLREIFTDNINMENRYGQAARGEIPLIIMVDNKDEIASIIQLKEKIIPKARIAIMGGAEAHLLASHLASAKIAVILRPYLCTPENFDSSHCLTGAPLTNGTAAHVLHYHGVKIGLGVSDDGWARNLAWDAGWLAATSPSEDMRITETEAIKFVTTNLQEIFGLKEEDESLNSDFVLCTSAFNKMDVDVFSMSLRY